MVVKFVHSTVLPGAADEIGSLCGAAVYANPRISVEVLLVPIMRSIVSSLAESPSTGFSGDGVRTEGADFKVWAFLIFVNRNVVISQIFCAFLGQSTYLYIFAFITKSVSHIHVILVYF